MTVLVSLGNAFAKSVPPVVLEKMLHDDPAAIVTGETQTQTETETETETGESKKKGFFQKAETGESKMKGLETETGESKKKGFFQKAEKTEKELVDSDGDGDDNEGEGDEDIKKSEGADKADMETVKETDTEKETEKEKKDLSQMFSDVIEKQPIEAQKLQGLMAGESNSKKNHKLSDEKRKERVDLIVTAVKRAFSECPSLKLLVGALLTTPAYHLYKTCRLVPGQPIAPMLAKPTKEIGEVLKRLSGQAFTMEYKYVNR